MRQKLLLLALLVFGLAVHVAAQNLTVIGTVSDESGDPLIGATIVLQGSTIGTTTDFDGSYQITAPANGTLIFSYIGYVEQVVGVNNRSAIDIVMRLDVAELGEVVVTSLGIEREKKALAYSVEEVSGDKFTEAREANIANALAGRIAGVNVSKTAGGQAGSSRVIIRGNKSLQGNNQPLYVVDGIPMDNSGFGQAGVWGGSDEGDGMTSINPDDIESITVLKGASAAALYGSRAANGVINIITKRGKSRKGIGVEVNSNFVLETINDLRNLQTEYGSGGISNGVATKPTTTAQAVGWSTSSWGPRLDGSTAIQVDGVSRPYSYTGDNWDRYYRTGSALTNSIALTGGSATQSFRFAVSDLRGTDIVPNAGFDRTNLSLSTNSRFGEKLTLDANVLYSYEQAQNRPRLSDSPANGILAMWYLPANYNVLDIQGDPNKLGAVPQDLDENTLSVWGKIPGEEFTSGSHNWHQNPYWTAHQFSNTDKRDRLISSSRLRYDITDFLYVQGRIGMDWYTRRDQFITPQGTSYQRGGSISEGEDRIREINMEYILGFNKTFGPISVNAFAGGNRMRRTSERISANGSGFNVPFFHAINNAVSRNYGYGFNEWGINSLFGSLEVGFNNYLYLTATGRNDWFSLLNPENNDVFYPSVGGSFVFSEVLGTLPSWLSYGKIRGSWAQVGNVTISPYSTNLTYSLRGESHLGRPLASFSQAIGNSGSIPNPNLVPLQSQEYEFGFDLRFLHNRIGLDFTYYNQETTDDILNATISRASGFGSTVVNLGKMKNNGVEVLLTASPVRGDLTWDVGFNFAKNNNEVVSLIEGLEELSLEEPRTRTVRIKHIVGQPFGTITGIAQKISPSGQPVFDADGRPTASDGYEIIGQGVADWTGGLNNAFSYKNFYLDFLIDFKFGGDIYAGTEARLTQAGLTKRTLQGREGEAPLSASGVTQTGTDANGNPVYESFSKTLTAEEAQSYWGGLTDRNSLPFMYDASFIKLRQVSVGFNFPQSLLGSTPFENLTLSFVGRNLAIIHRDTDNIDPEASYTNSNSQGLDYFGALPVRSYGINLRATF